MTERGKARHRAPSRATTPLTGSLSLVAEHAGTIGRTGAVLAASSGLAATVALPANATVAHSVASSGVQASGAGALAAQLATSLYSGQPGGVLTVPADLVLTGDAIEAPKTAHVAMTAPAFSPVLTGDEVPTIVGGPAGHDGVDDGMPGPAPSETSAPAPVTPPKASAPAETTKPAVRPAPAPSVRGSGILAVASRYAGVPYVMGGTTPNGLDCSGFTQLVYRNAGKSIPRTTDQQYAAATKIRSGEAKPGDLVFFYGGGHISHVAIWAGDGMIWDAGSSPHRVTKRKLWTSNVAFGRF